MTRQLITAASTLVPGVAHRKSLRNAAAVAGVAALIAVGGYGATKTFGPDSVPEAAPATSANSAPSAQVLRDLHESIAGQYGSQRAAASSADSSPSDQIMRELHKRIAGQYGGQPAAASSANSSPSAEVMRELRDSIAGQYGPVR